MEHLQAMGSVSPKRNTSTRLKRAFTSSRLFTERLLEAFRNRVKTGRIVAEYTSAGDVPAIAAVSMHHAMKDHPAVGWIRADSVATEDPPTNRKQRQKDYEELAAEVDALQPTMKADDVAEASAEFARRVQRPYLTGGGDVDIRAGQRCFRLEVQNNGKTPAFLSHYDVRFETLDDVRSGPNAVAKRHDFVDQIAPDEKKVLDCIAMPPHAEIIYGAFWYQDFEKREYIFRFILRIAADGHTRPDVTGVDTSYRFWD